MKVTLINPKTGIRKNVGTGFDWIVFIFGGFFGVPLFIRGLILWGVIEAIINFPFLFIDTSAAFYWSLALPVIGVNLYLGFKVNEITLKSLLEKGYKFENPDAPETQMTKKKWNIA